MQNCIFCIFSCFCKLGQKCCQKVEKTLIDEDEISNGEIEEITYKSTDDLSKDNQIKIDSQINEILRDIEVEYEQVEYEQADYEIIDNELINEIEIFDIEEVMPENIEIKLQYHTHKDQ